MNKVEDKIEAIEKQIAELKAIEKENDDSSVYQDDIDILMDILKADKGIFNVQKHKWYATIEYSSKQNRNHMFHSKVFPSTDIRKRLIGEGYYKDVTKIPYEKNIDIGKTQRLITYRKTDVATLSNSHNFNGKSETLGYPFSRNIAYQMIADGKDRLQYRRTCYEKHAIDKDGRRKKPLDNVFITRVVRLFLRFKGYTSTEIWNTLRTQGTISGVDVVEMLQYLYSAIKSYHPFFYKTSGVCKYNAEWLFHTIHSIQQYGFLDYDYKFAKVNRNLNVERNIIKPKDVVKWRNDRKHAIDNGEYVDIIYE